MHCICDSSFLDLQHYTEFGVCRKTDCMFGLYSAGLGTDDFDDGLCSDVDRKTLLLLSTLGYSFF